MWLRQRTRVTRGKQREAVFGNPSVFSFKQYFFRFDARDFAMALAQNTVVCTDTIQFRTQIRQGLQERGGRIAVLTN
ncbi:hypothetical protein VI03_30935 [Burkholderia vietnamiensis]|uniref:Uncharacterized protein n=1 Tax=Burkholderia ubonensis TaxID=101571 RepID=A0A1B4LEH1_9BURK|nr:hypothetical protein WJ35_11305 [Burkholderia ubonensis]AOJ97176.1 hypothetical protein WK23_00055 [Burkholderia vietnamiensis]AOK08762.1 hypothetical protein WK31_00095 [Burkholderia vietnamiensis]KKI34974.1 hypothetical protein VI03_30935 [Burkholderia vietnamiensis]KVE20898.1 hypothetical protein WI92_26485 [Burkholderia vietnamiensis]